MERIGIAASKMAKGNLALYNLYVVLITFIFTFFIFVVTGFSVFFALMIIAYVEHQVMSSGFSEQWLGIFKVCMACLTIILSLFGLVAISKNIKLVKK